MQKYLDERGLRVLAALDEVSARLSSAPARVALAWLMARPSITAPIASATNLDQLKDLIAATELKLDGESIEYSESRERAGARGGDSVGGGFTTPPVYVWVCLCRRA